jgi:hypothetical protein
MVESGTSFHMNSHIEWFCEYERYDRGDVFLRDDLKTKILGREKFNLNIMDERIITLPSVMNILGLGRNFIFVSKIDDAGVKIVFEK